MAEEKNSNYEKKLRELLDFYVHKVYDCTESFPKSEIFGLTSQFRSAALSVVLNYIEGYVRRRDKVFLNFLEISYGSLMESRYLIDFSLKRKLISLKDREDLIKVSNEVGAMLWGIIRKIEKFKE